MCELHNLIFPQNAIKDKFFLEKTSISLDFFMKRLDISPINVFFFIDSCREIYDKSLGQDTSGIESFNFQKKVPRPQGVSCFYSCWLKQKSWPFKKKSKEYSIFSYALLKGLSGKISLPIHFGQLVEFTKDKVESIIDKYKVKHHQTPKDEASGEADELPVLGLRFKERRMEKLRDPKFVEKLQSLLKEYTKKIEDLKVVLVFHKDGDLVHYITRSSKDNVGREIVESINSNIDSYSRCTEEISLIIITKPIKYMCIYRKAGNELVFITVLDAEAMPGSVFPFVRLCAENISDIYDGRPTKIVFPELEIKKRIRIMGQQPREKEKKEEIETFFFLSINPSNPALPEKINLWKDLDLLDPNMWNTLFYRLDYNSNIKILNELINPRETREITIKPNIRT